MPSKHAALALMILPPSWAHAKSRIPLTAGLFLLQWSWSLVADLALLRRLTGAAAQGMWRTPHASPDIGNSIRACLGLLPLQWPT